VKRGMSACCVLPLASDLACVPNHSRFLEGLPPKCPPTAGVRGYWYPSDGGIGAFLLRSVYNNAFLLAMVVSLRARSFD
jgi:hypothetical protein